MKKFLIFIFLMFFFLITPVYASSYENFDTTYNFTIDESSLDLDSSVDSSDHKLSSLVDSITGAYSEHYYVILSIVHGSSGFENLRVFLIDKSEYSYLNFAYVGINSSISSINSKFISSSQTFYAHQVIIPFNSASVFQTQQYLDVISCLDNGGCNTTYAYLGDYVQNNYSSSSYFTNDSSYNTSYATLPNSRTYDVLYYSNIPLIFSNSTFFYSAYTGYYKSLNINDVSYTLGSQLPTYYDLFIHSTFNVYNTSLDDLYIGSIPKNQLSNFHIDLSFSSFTENYSSSIYFNANFYGRINHNNYYTYEKIDCSQPLSSWAIDNLNYVGRIFYNGVSCSSDLTNYDNIYIKIQTIPKVDSFDSSLFNLKISSSFGSIINLPTSIGSYYGIEIYENFKNLSNTFSILLSSNRKYSRYYSLSDNDNIFVNMLSKNGLTNSTNNILYDSIFGTNNNLSLLLYNIPSYYNGLTNLKLFVDSETMISLSDNYSYSYYDSSGSISNGVISPNDLNINSSDDSYDVSYYFNVVSSYIDSLSDDLYQLHSVIQEGYDLIPEPFSSLILVLFILSCTFFILCFIRRD